MTNNYTKKETNENKIKNTVDDVYCIEPDLIGKEHSMIETKRFEEFPHWGMFHFVSVYIFFSFYFCLDFFSSFSVG